MIDLKWTRVPPETPPEGPDVKGFYDVCWYKVNVNKGNYDQWTHVEYMFDTKHDPPLFWRKMIAGQETSWAVALVPDWPKKAEEKKV